MGCAVFRAEGEIRQSVGEVMFREFDTSKTRTRVFCWNMRVRVLYFGVLKEGFGSSGGTMELAEGARVADLLAACRERFAGPDGLWESLAVAVNQEYARRADALRDGDEVALLPPVSGGAERSVA